MESKRDRRASGRRATWAVVAVTAVLLAGCGPTTTDIGTLGGTTARANDIQADGVVVGASKSRQGFDHAYWYDPLNKTMIDLHPKGYAFSGAAGISDGGLIAGTAVTNDLHSVGWVWHTATGASMPLEKNPGFDRVIPTAVSSDGLIAGYGVTASGQVSAVYWLRDGISQGGPSPAGNESIATGVDRHDRIIGLLGPLCCPTASFVTDSAHGRRELSASPYVYAFAYGINDVGDIVGEGWDPWSYWQVPIAWNAETLATTPVPTLSGRTNGGLVDVNDDHIAVGWSINAGADPNSNPPRHAYCVSLTTGHTVDLGVATASAINNAGVIAGTKDGRAVTWPAGSCSH